MTPRSAVAVLFIALTTACQWLSTQTYEAQRAFGLKAIENIAKGVW